LLNLINIQSLFFINKFISPQSSKLLLLFISLNADKLSAWDCLERKLLRAFKVPPASLFLFSERLTAISRKID